jgi:hypothetical protein
MLADHRDQGGGRPHHTAGSAPTCNCAVGCGGSTPCREVGAPHGRSARGCCQSSKVVAGTAHLARHCLPEVGEGLHMVCLTEPALALHQGAAQALLRGLALQPYLACPGPSPGVGQAQASTGRPALARSTGLASVLWLTAQPPGLGGVETPPPFPSRHGRTCRHRGASSAHAKRARASLAYRRRVQEPRQCGGTVVPNPCSRPWAKRAVALTGETLAPCGWPSSSYPHPASGYQLCASRHSGAETSEQRAVLPARRGAVCGAAERHTGPGPERPSTAPVASSPPG